MRRVIRCAGLVALLFLTATSPAGAQATDDRDIFDGLAGVTDDGVRSAIVDLAPDVVDLEPGVEDVETEATDGPETVLSLNSDILFAFDKASISPRAATKIGELVKDLPRKAEVEVGGHTDALGTDARNRALSQERAEAVAAVITKARPDLSLTVEGFGDSRPVASNGSAGQDDPEGRAKNRRVEIRYTD